LAAELKDAFGVETELMPGGRGAFDVFADGELMFSRKQQNKRFPDEGEVVSLIQQKMS